MGTVQKFLSGLTALGALYLVANNPKGIYSAALGLQKLTGGSITQIVTGGKKGG